MSVCAGGLLTWDRKIMNAHSESGPLSGRKPKSLRPMLTGVARGVEEELLRERRLQCSFDLVEVDDLRSSVPAPTE